jgi:hypothetical protein
MPSDHLIPQKKILTAPSNTSWLHKQGLSHYALAVLASQGPRMVPAIRMSYVNHRVFIWGFAKGFAVLLCALAFTGSHVPPLVNLWAICSVRNKCHRKLSGYSVDVSESVGVSVCGGGQVKVWGVHVVCECGSCVSVQSCKCKSTCGCANVHGVYSMWGHECMGKCMQLPLDKSHHLCSYSNWHTLLFPFFWPYLDLPSQRSPIF